MKTLLINEAAPAYGDLELIKQINEFVVNDEIVFETSSGALSRLLLSCAVINVNGQFSDYILSDGVNLSPLNEYNKEFPDIINEALESVLMCGKSKVPLRTSKIKKLIINEAAPAYGDLELIKQINEFVINDEILFETSSAELSRILLRSSIRTNNNPHYNFVVSDGTITIDADSLPLQFSSIVNDSIEKIYFHEKDN